MHRKKRACRSVRMPYRGTLIGRRDRLRVHVGPGLHPPDVAARGAGSVTPPWRSPAWGGGRLATPTRTPRRSVVGRICRTGDQRKSRIDDTRWRVGYVPVPPHLSTMLPPLSGPVPHVPLVPVSKPMPSSPLLMSVCISSETIRNTSSRFGERAGERGDDHRSRGEVGWASA